LGYQLTMKNVKNTLKIIYIFLAGIGVFFIANIYILLAVIALHLIFFITIKNPQKSLRFLLRVKWFIVIIFLGNAFTGENDITLLYVKEWDWRLALSYEGMLTGAIMCGRLISMLLITQIVRFSMSKKDFVGGLTGVGLSTSSAEIIDTIIEIVSTEGSTGKAMGNGHGGGNGGGGGNKGGGKNSAEDKQEDKAINVLLKGKVGNIPKKLVERLDFASGKFVNNPHAALASSALAITLIRMVKIAPGLPLAPGHKNILAFPVFIYGISKSEKPFAGLQIGLISGILHFSMGFGKYGPMSIFEFAIVGGLIDLLLKLPIKRTNLVFLMFIGAVAGAARIGIEICLVYFLLPKESDVSNAFLLLYLPYIISQIAFGIASGFISRAILKNNNNEQ